ncbi:hypothetical protein OROGR_007921 [Orobanche gracilis]
MATIDLGAKMPRDRHCPRIDTAELKHHIDMKLGPQKSGKYFDLLSKYLSLQLSKFAFDKLCVGLLGRENISLHNRLIHAIIKNACLVDAPPNKEARPESSLKVTNGYQSSLPLLRDVFPQSPRKGRTPSLRVRKSKDRPSPLGPNGKAHIVEQQNGSEMLSLGSRPPVEVISEDGEEVQELAVSPGIHSRTPIKAPFGICFNPKETRNVLTHESSPLIDLDTCYNNTDLPDTSSLRKRLKQKLATEGLNVSTYCVNLINNGLDAYLKRLLKPCLDLAASRSVQNPHVSVKDFEVAMQLNPSIIGQDWAVLTERVGMRATDDYMDG